MKKFKNAPGVNLDEKTITFDYIKSPNHRTIIAEGVFGGISPRGRIIMSIWNERWPIPKQSVSAFDETGKLGDEILSERVTRDAVIREVDVSISFDITTATTMRDWLNEKIKTLIAEIEKSADQEGEHD